MWRTRTWGAANGVHPSSSVLRTTLGRNASGLHSLRIAMPPSCALLMPQSRSLSSFATRKLFDIEPRERVRSKLVNQGTSLKQPLPGLDAQIATSAADVKDSPDTLLTTLPNGIRVASEPSLGQAANLSLFVAAGSANETEATNGTTHILQRLGFKATKNFTGAQIVRTLEATGANAVSSSSREFMMYSMDALQEHIPALVEILADSIQRPELLEEDIEDQKQAIMNELDDIALEPSYWMTDVIYEIAFGRQGLGLSQLCPPNNLANITKNVLEEFIDTYYRTPNVVVSSVGLDHNVLVDLIGKNFNSLKTERSPNEVRLPVKYSGGVLVEPMDPQTEKRIKDVRPQTGLATPTYIAMAFNAPSMLSDDVYGATVLKTLMGGGASFSSGGPGKGMYSRLYQQVLNQFWWADSISSLYSFHNDAALFGLFATAPHDKLADMMQVMAEQLYAMTLGFSDEEVQRAKNQLRSQIFMALESRSVASNDIGQQILTHGRRMSADEIGERIEKVTGEEMQRIARDIVSSSPVMVVYTPEKYAHIVPDHVSIEHWFKSALESPALH